MLSVFSSRLVGRGWLSLGRRVAVTGGCDEIKKFQSTEGEMRMSSVKKWFREYETAISKVLSEEENTKLEMFKQLCREEYAANKNDLDKAFTSLLNENKQRAAGSQESSTANNKSTEFVLFMHGTPDKPLSMTSLNAIKILTQTQIVPLTCINILQHPAIYGYTTSIKKDATPPLLFKNGALFADHDELVSLYQKGALEKFSVKANLEKNPYYEGELPIALY